MHKHYISHVFHFSNYMHNRNIIFSWSDKDKTSLGKLVVSFHFQIERKQLTAMILSFQTDWSEQTVQTLEEQSDQGLHCLPFRLYRLDSLLYGRAT